MKQLKQVKQLKQLKRVKLFGATKGFAFKGKSRVAMSGHFRHATIFPHRSPAANGILNDMDEKNEMDDMEVLDSCEVARVSKLQSYGEYDSKFEIPNSESSPP
ncbi:MAG: hypothetical protein KF762_14450 [Acidobacteria bacterium]|nr:hypothetical protein [Acidobacteriota bacterium]